MKSQSRKRLVIGQAERMALLVAITEFKIATKGLNDAETKSHLKVLAKIERWLKRMEG